MDEFIKTVKENQENIKYNDAFVEIINKLMQKNLRQQQKLNDIGDYDSETLFDGKLFRGNIYIFQYDSKSLSTYTYNGESVQYSDNLPIVLMTNEGANTIRGINLNMCNKGLTTLLLNMIQNLDEDFYINGGAERLAYNKSLVISKKVYSFLTMQGTEKAIIEQLSRYCPNVDYSSIFRNYSVDRIKNIRLIEPWQWKYLPFLNYQGSIKKETLDAIHKISGISKIKI